MFIFFFRKCSCRAPPTLPPTQPKPTTCQQGKNCWDDEDCGGDPHWCEIKWSWDTDTQVWPFNQVVQPAGKGSRMGYMFR